MRRIIALAALLGGFSACAASAASTQPTRIVFGVGGGSMVPFQVVIAATGTVRTSGGPRVTRKHLPTTAVLTLDREVRSAFASGVTSRLCRGTNPDVGSDFITLGRRTVRVHGGCEPRFSRLWKALATAVGLRFG
jgi:hypothetical protein